MKSIRTTCALLTVAATLFAFGCEKPIQEVRQNADAQPQLTRAPHTAPRPA